MASLSFGMITWNGMGNSVAMENAKQTTDRANLKLTTDNEKPDNVSGGCQLSVVGLKFAIAV
jgi:hypothetical protein